MASPVDPGWRRSGGGRRVVVQGRFCLGAGRRPSTTTTTGRRQAAAAPDPSPRPPPSEPSSSSPSRCRRPTRRDPTAQGVLRLWDFRKQNVNRRWRRESNWRQHCAPARTARLRAARTRSGRSWPRRPASPAPAGARSWRGASLTTAGGCGGKQTTQRRLVPARWTTRREPWSGTRMLGACERGRRAGAAFVSLQPVWHNAAGGIAAAAGAALAAPVPEQCITGALAQPHNQQQMEHDPCQPGNQEQ